MQDQEEAESKLAPKNKWIEELEVYKLNSISLIVFLEENKKRLMIERDSGLKRNKYLLDSNT